MSENIGLDFGTTYSVVARLKEVNDLLIPEVIDFGNEERTITSMESLVVVCDEDDPRIGYEAVPAMDEDDAIIYHGFKMMLNCSDKKMLKDRGYAKVSPEEVTALFMSELFKKVKTVAPECREIDNVVVGVPLVWTQNGEDTRKYEVADIVKRTTGASVVEFKAEPTLACAYFVEEINKKRDKKYEGYILVIDYGGGTLDITLCKATNKGGQSVIEVCDNWGRGENTDGTVGSAGLSFMEKVADILLEEDGIHIENKDDPNYQLFKKNIETAIKSQTDSLKEKFQRDRYRKKDGEKYNSSIGATAYYKGKKYSIKYSTLVEAYGAKNGIRDILSETLEEAKRDMDKANIPYDDYLNGTFKIATIGGFCNFSLTEMQIRKDTDWLKSHHDKHDTRYTELDEIVRPKNRELAIAYGAALNANNVVGIKKQFPYTLCFYSETFMKDDNGNRVKKNGKDVLVANEEEEFIMFREKDEYEPGKPVFFGIEETDENGSISFRRISVRGDSVPYIRRKKKKNQSDIKQPTNEMKLPKNENEDLYLAMAMERNENLTLYAYDRKKFDMLSKEEQEDPNNSALVGTPSKLPNIDKLLGSFYESR